MRQLSTPSKDIYGLEPIGYVRSCFREKFGTPRQPGLISSATGEIVIHSPFHTPHAFTQLEQFSHIWVLFLFHQALRDEWKPRVRPPRLGGNESLGVFASRSPFRPNPIGLSPLKLERIEYRDKETRLHVRGLDLVDGTPVLDIKPYLPYVDAISDAHGGYASAAPAPVLDVEFEPGAARKLEQLLARYPELQKLIIETVGTDPRPAYRHQSNTSDPERIYGVRLYDLNVRWCVEQRTARIIAIDAESGDGESGDAVSGDEEQAMRSRR